MTEMIIISVSAGLFLTAVMVRLLFLPKWTKEPVCVAISQSMGRREIQADYAEALSNCAGTIAVLADGTGSENTGKVCAHLAADSVLDCFEPYQILNNPIYFFKSTFAQAHRRIRQTIGERRGGAGMAAVFVNRTHLYYASAGDLRIALMRGKELIPLNEGQTVDVLAAEAYHMGNISRQEAIWSMDEKRIWNYLGKDGFREIERCDRPIRLKDQDTVLMVSRGIFETVSWGEMEDILLERISVQSQADAIVQKAESKQHQEMDNGSVLLLKVRVETTDEKDKF